MFAYLSQVFAFMRGRPDHPVYRKEILGWSYIKFWRNLRSGCVPSILILMVLAVVGCGLMALCAFASDASTGAAPDWPLAVLLSLSAGVIGLFYVGEMVLLVAGLLATVLTSTSISAELENDSYGLMRLTMIPPREIVLAKFGAVMREMRRPVVAVLTTRTIFVLSIPILVIAFFVYAIGSALGASGGAPTPTPSPIAPAAALPVAIAPLIALMATSALVAVSVGLAILLTLIYYFIQPTLDMMLFSALGVAASTMARTRSSGLFTGFGFRVGLWGAACIANQIISSAISLIMTPMMVVGSTTPAIVDWLTENPALFVAGYAGSIILSVLVVIISEFVVSILLLRFAESRAARLPFID